MSYFDLICKLYFGVLFKVTSRNLAIFLDMKAFNSSVKKLIYNPDGPFSGGEERGEERAVTVSVTVI